VTSILTAPPAKKRRSRRAVLIAFAALVLYGAVSSMGIAFAVLALLTLGVVVVWRHPAWTAVMLVALVPVNRFLILLVFHYGHSSALTSLAQLWKDLLIAILTFRTLDDLILRRRQKIHYVDVLIAALVALSLLYLIYPGPTGQIDFLERVIGFRADTWFLFAYFVGRGIVLQRRHVRALLTWLIPGTVIVDVVACIQFAVPNWFNDFFNRLGFSAFISTQSSYGDADVIRLRGIPGAADLPRASSLLLGDLALSFFSVLAICVGAALLLTATTSKARWGYGAFTAFAFAGMTLTLTRSALIAATVMLLFMGIVTWRWRLIGPLLVALVIAALLAMASGIIPTSAVSALANPHEASIQAHGGAIESSLTLLQHNPFGLGLGTTGTIGQRIYGTGAITTENWFLGIAVEIGVVPSLLFVAASIGVGIEAFLSFRRVKDPSLRCLSLAVLGGSVGFLVLASVLSAWEVPVVSMAFWLLAGVAVGARETDEDPEYESSP
jgi:hypothetical protein